MKISIVLIYVKILTIYIYQIYFLIGRERQPQKNIIMEQETYQYTATGPKPPRTQTELISKKFNGNVFLICTSNITPVFRI